MQIVVDQTFFGWSFMVVRFESSVPLRIEKAHPGGFALTYRSFELIVCRHTPPN
jgi:hypothetical protein